ncbi:hypothetical protein [Citricoccus sp.]|uniref:hypothetical protein n=1 Tax=Citricoccus sp. TaxID=1978372 RepID=UPI0028BE4F65|nr:hypothetical protein [Citricoccus sp.]
MTTPIPVKPSRRKRPATGPRPRLKMSLYGFLVAWLAPNLLMAAIVLVLNFIPALQAYGSLTPLLTTVGLAGLVIGLPLCLLVNWLFRHQANQWIHVIGYALVGMLYGLAVLFSGVGGLLPMLIPIIGFPAAILMALGRAVAQPLVRVVRPETTSAAA